MQATNHATNFKYCLSSRVALKSNKTEHYLKQKFYSLNNKHV